MSNHLIENDIDAILISRKNRDNHGTSNIRDNTFCLTDMQQSFIVGQYFSRKIPEGAHIYIELTLDKIDLDKLDKSFGLVLERHEMLRAVIIDNKYQKILDKSLCLYNISHLDLSSETGAQKQIELEKLRCRVKNKKYDITQWPLFTIMVCCFSSERYKVLFGINELIADGPSLSIILRDWYSFYDNLPARPLAYTFKEYIAQHFHLENTSHNNSYQYWIKKLSQQIKWDFADMVFPYSSSGSLHCGQNRLLSALEKNEWMHLQEFAKKYQVTPSLLLLTLFGVFFLQKIKHCFPIMLTQYNRKLFHEDVKNIVGPFISSSIFLVNNKFYNVAEIFFEAQQQLFSDLDFFNVSMVEILRKLRKEKKINFNLIPLVYTSLVDVLQNDYHHNQWSSKIDLSHSLTQTPQVLLEHILYKHNDQYFLIWDYAKNFISDNKIKELFISYEKFIKDCLATNSIANFESVVIGHVHLLSEHSTTCCRNECQIEPDLKPNTMKEEVAGFIETFSNKIECEANHDITFPLASMQAAYYVGKTLYFDGAICQMYQEFDGKYIDLERLNTALNILIQHHGMLRAIITHDGKQRMMSCEKATYMIKIIDLRDKFTEKKTEYINEIRDNFANKVYPLDDWPNFDVYVSLLNDSDSIIHINIDPIILDANSIALIFKQLFALYNGDIIRLEPINISYVSYIDSIQKIHAQAYLESNAFYWKNKFEQLPAAPQIFRKGVDQYQKQKRTRKEFVYKHWNKVKDVALKHKISLDFLLLAAYVTAISKCNTYRSFTLVVVFWERENIHAHVDKLAGDFTTLFWFNCQYINGQSILELARSLNNQYEEDKGHSLIGGVIALQKINSTKKHLPEISYPIVYTSLTQHQVKLPTNISSSYGISQTPGVYLDNLSVQSHDDSLQMMWDYIPAAFDDTVIESMFEDYISGLDKIYVEMEDFLHNHTICQLITEQLNKTPNAIAAIYDDQTLTYRQLDEQSNRLARYLQNFKIAVGDCVGIFLERSLDLIVAILSCIKTGGVYVPLDIAFPENRLKYIIDEAKLSVIITNSVLNDKIKHFNINLINIDLDWGLIEQESKMPLEVLISPEDLIYVIYTSGTTGGAKGCMNTHKGIVNRITWMQNTFQLTTKDAILQKTPFTFDVSGWEFYWPLICGAKIVFAKPNGHKDTNYLIDTINKYNISTVHFVPSMLSVFLQNEKVSSIHSLRRVFVSGEALSTRLNNKFYEVFKDTELHNLYGPTETAIDVTHWHCRKKEILKSIPIGSPIANTYIYILDEYLNIVAPGKIGEIYVGGYQVGKGYLNKPELTSERFIKNPFPDFENERLYKTGDLGKFIDDTNIEFLGRIDDQIKLRGFRIELSEIENAILQHPQVNNAVVIVRDDIINETVLVSYYSTLNQKVIEKGEFSEILTKILPNYMIPSYFVFLSSIPVTENGKIDRRKLKNLPIQTTEHLYHTHKMDILVIKRHLLEWCYENLGCLNIEDDTNLFELGASSLTAIQLAQVINHDFQVQVPLEIFLGQFTITRLANYICHSAEPIIETPKPILEQVQLSEKFILDVAFNLDAKEKFVAERHGLRKDLDSHEVIIFTNSQFSENKKINYLHLSSIRDYADAAIPFDDFQNFIECLHEFSIDNKFKRQYPSAGNLYPVQVYVFVKKKSVEGVKEGLYYYQPVDNKLILLTPNVEKISEKIHYRHNAAIFRKSAFSIFLIANMKAINPVYGQEAGWKYSVLEAGYIGELLMNKARENNLGLCAIGDMNFELIKPLFDLPDQSELVHSFLGGKLLSDTMQINSPRRDETKIPITSDNDDKKIAIIGIHGKFPDANSLSQYWENLKNKKISIKEVLSDYNVKVQEQNLFYSKWGAFLEDISTFDFRAFGVTDEEIFFIDPQERIFLESVSLCLASAGLNPQQIHTKRRKIGVFVGSMWSDYANYAIENWIKNAEVGIYVNRASLANRISFIFNFIGPSVAIDTSCSSSISAINLASNAILSNECEMVIAGGVNLILHPYHYALLCKSKMIAKNKFSSPLSAEATGWIPGEGVGCVLLKPLNKAIADGDYIYAVILGSEMRHTGKTRGFGMPDPEIQSEILQNLLRKTNIDKNSISYIEMAAAGSSMLDSAEISAIKTVFGDSPKTCFLGIVKANIGHLESASGISQLAKVLLQMENKSILPSIVPKEMNPFVNLEGTNLKLVDEEMDWMQFAYEDKLRAIINSYGGMGVYSSLLIENYKNTILKKNHPFNTFNEVSNPTQLGVRQDYVAANLPSLKCWRDALASHSKPQGIRAQVNKEQYDNIYSSSNQEQIITKFKQIISDILSIDIHYIDDDFELLAHGMDSYLAIKIATKFNAEFEVPLPIESLFKCVSIRDIVEYIWEHAKFENKKPIVGSNEMVAIPNDEIDRLPEWKIDELVGKYLNLISNKTPTAVE